MNIIFFSQPIVPVTMMMAKQFSKMYENLEGSKVLFCIFQDTDILNVVPASTTRWALWYLLDTLGGGL